MLWLRFLRSRRRRRALRERCAGAGFAAGFAAVATLVPFAGPAAAACPATSGETAAVTSVDARLELKLADGRLLRLAGLDPALGTPDAPDLAETGRARLAAMVAGHGVTLSLLAGAPDRWGRLAARADLTDAPREGGLAAELVAEGLGRYLAEPAAAACRDTLLAAERQARSAKLGLWRDPYYGVLAVDDRAGFDERSGTIVVAEGRLAAVQPGPFRTTLRFAAPDARDPPGQSSFGGHMLVATIVPHAMKSFGAQHMDFPALIGHRLRFRGLLDQRFGPRIDLQSPDQVEALDAPAQN